jgi:ubiquinone/menaquinone biosynthesis C-methylase UbiE
MTEDVFQQRFEALLCALKPRSVLDVGCGEGGLVQAASKWAKRVEGVDVDRACVEKARKKGLAVREARAEALPFADGEFDVVVSQYAAHHVADSVQVTQEMLRVARIGVLILDVWYDATVPTQAASIRFDKWFKRIDEDNGMVHRPALSAHDIAGPLLNDPRYRSGIEHWLVNDISPWDECMEYAREQLARSLHRERDEAEWAAIEAEGRRTGFGTEGAVVVTLLKNP